MSRQAGSTVSCVSCVRTGNGAASPIPTRPSESLSFAKRLDQTQVFKESVTGGGGQTWNLDKDMAFAQLDFDAFQLPAFPDLPVDNRAQSALQACCGRIFERERSHVDAIMEEVFDPADKTVCILDRN